LRRCLRIYDRNQQEREDTCKNAHICFHKFP
jgi:hypothetical protein